MHYLIDMGDGETYAVCNFGTVRWISDKPLRFNVVAYAGFNDEDVNVYANGKALAPDADGYYTLQKLDRGDAEACCAKSVLSVHAAARPSHHQPCVREKGKKGTGDRLGLEARDVRV